MLHHVRVATLAAAVIGAAACADAPSAPSASLAPGDAPSLSAAAPQPSVAKFEVDYMMMTIDHHLAGIVMAQMCIEKAVHEELRALCRESLASQQRQIALYRSWLQQWYGISYAGEIPQSAAQDIRRLSELSGAAFEDEFLTEFSKHHLRIIKESEKAVERVYHEELRREAQMTVTNQSRQVVQMQTWDCQWYDDCRQGLIEQVQNR
ncbi:DUF305 domain-containing protein [Roseisolibacter agri]|uniref:DUF305 domain-containing protein n=1 Tax=Roseisolibacter agri TaxID=2014610 RepID=A0AA37VCV9_9BACT|nr:DUF305 domain-containing protein [Roseisolibacter agri]GLC28153.1 hypothetical protein rosag_46660 [Roseisolibacter agri]